MEVTANLGMEYLKKLLDWTIVDGSLVVLTVIVAMFALRLANILSSKLFGLVQKTKEDVDFQKRADTLSAVVRWILRTTIYGVAGMMILKRFGFDIGPIIAAAGVLGVAVGFGARSLVEDTISGFFILFEDQIRVGDVVQLNDRGGLVERVTLRMVILRDYAGNVHYVRNGSIGVVTNMTKDFSRYVFDIGVAYREDVDEVIRVIKQLDEELRKDPEFMNDIISPLEVAGLDKFGDSAIIIKARITTKPIQQWRIGREFNRRIKKRFDELGIEIPFPHLTVYAGADKDGGAPSFRLASPGDPGAGLTGSSLAK
jgi:moderate conductance mechanosensitive channel